MGNGVKLTARGCYNHQELHAALITWCALKQMDKVDEILEEMTQAELFGLYNDCQYLLSLNKDHTQAQYLAGAAVKKLAAYKPPVQPSPEMKEFMWWYWQNVQGPPYSTTAEEMVELFLTEKQK